MDPLIGGALISGASNLLGGLLGQSSSSWQFERQRNMQYDFAKNGIQWKVEDAKKAGIHPLAALGAQTISASPISVDGGNSFGAGVAAAGQDIGRAIQATRTPGDKDAAYIKSMQDLALQRAGLENTLLASQIAKVNQPATGPGMPANTWLVDGQGQTAVSTPSLPSGGPLVSDKPLERVISDPSAPYQEGGAINDVGFARTPTGYAVVPSNDMKQRIDDDLIGTLIWNWRNRVYPTAQVKSRMTPPFPAPPGSKWFYSPLMQEYQLDYGPAAKHRSGGY